MEEKKEVCDICGQEVERNLVTGRFECSCEK